MSIEVRAEGLADLLDETNRHLEQVARAGRATNIILLANAMGVDPTEPLARAKVERHLATLVSTND
ncbi:hypothetical protein GCM10011376_29900 [Nocardioides flavus (ex Wang et al. 2016)]|uniref:Uncharacterized protein n=1 Tax=Nocardioides flavus (ex Wang et al. 2016) TaxID=2058780 RepID=A0ABQ3HL38_9ACTN|nr:hypothetical protein GCM10011376_29900 [Nocardioides flavus (ex Wang et al. 2016)]